jgi:hypothetical protein
MTGVPTHPKIYHIVHVDRLPSIVADGHLWCDAEAIRRRSGGTTIGMSSIKRRRLGLPLTSWPDLMVGSCVPFYFCPRSIMLFLIHKANHPELAYRGGQSPIVHLECDLSEVITLAAEAKRRWAFTLSNAGSTYFEDRADVSRLSEIDWTAVQSNNWSAPSVRESKQAEFLVERCFPWGLVSRIGVLSSEIAHRASLAMGKAKHRPPIEIRRDWYY